MGNSDNVTSTSDIINPRKPFRADTAQLSLGRADPDGKITVWDIPAKKWKRVPYVDAREQINMGTALLNPPKGVDPGPRPQMPSNAPEIIPGSQQPVEVPGSPATPQSPSTQEDEPQDNRPPFDFTKSNIDQLRAWAKQAGIDAEGKNKTALATALDEVGFRP